MKKVFLVVISCLLMLSLFGCKKNETDSTKDSALTAEEFQSALNILSNDEIQIVYHSGGSDKLWKYTKDKLYYESEWTGVKGLGDREYYFIESLNEKTINYNSALNLFYTDGENDKYSLNEIKEEFIGGVVDYLECDTIVPLFTKEDYIFYDDDEWFSKFDLLEKMYNVENWIFSQEKGTYRFDLTSAENVGKGDERDEEYEWSIIITIENKKIVKYENSFFNEIESYALLTYKDVIITKPETIYKLDGIRYYNIKKGIYTIDELTKSEVFKSYKDVNWISSNEEIIYVYDGKLYCTTYDEKDYTNRNIKLGRISGNYVTIYNFTVIG